uniref:Uncharacterized protein n=1 Tax=Wuchereria bancrofti TaxID=6293 RepID=A0A1I8EXM2_WUCBA
MCANLPSFNRVEIIHQQEEQRCGQGSESIREKEVQEIRKVEGTVCVQRGKSRVETEAEEEEAFRGKPAAHHPHFLAQTSKTIRNGAALNGVDMTVHDSSSSDLYVHSSSSGGLENIDPEINSKKGKGQQKNYLKEREKMEKSDEEEEEEGINGRLPIRLIHQPSEEGFHQVVKFTKRATRRGEKELPKAKSFAFAEFSEEEKSSSKRENISSIAISRDSTSQELDNYTTFIEQNLDAGIRFQSEYCKPDDKTYLKSANANTNSYYLNCDTTELQHLNCESVCAESEVLDETMIEADNLPQQIHKKHDQQECDRTKICLENCGSQTDEESKISTTLWKTIANKPTQTQVILKKKRCHECFADAVFNAADSTVQQQQESLDKNRAFIISDPQHCSVSATLSLGRPKKLFINKGKIAERSRAVATFQASTTITPQRQNLNNSKEISTSHTKIDQKSAFETKATSPSSSQHFRDSVNSNNDSISSLLQQNCPKTVPSDPIPINSAETASLPKCSDTVTPEITIDIPHPDSPQSTLNSRGSDGYRGDCSSVNSLHSAEYKDGMNRRQNNINEFRESLSSRLSRGFLEFTQGSSDRLQKWKNKLQNGRRHKDSSEPPPANRKMPTTNQEQNGHLSDVEVILDWATLKCDSTDQIHNAKFSPMRSAFALKEDRPNLILPTRSTSDFFLTISVSSKFFSRATLNGSGTIMDQQTLKQRDSKGPQTVKNLTAHFQNLKNIQTTTAQTVENCDNLSNNLPPPVRITPYSGVKPKDMDIIRPVAFRPYASRKSDKWQTVISSSFSFYNSNKKNDFLTKRLSNSDDLKRSSQHSKDTMSNSSAPSSGYGSTRPRAIYQPSTSFQMTSAMVAQKRSNKIETEENDYDVVPEYVERDKFYING